MTDEKRTQDYKFKIQNTCMFYFLGLAWSKCFPRLHKRQQNYGLLGPLDKFLCEKRIHPGRRLMDSKHYVKDRNVILNASLFYLYRYLTAFELFPIFRIWTSLQASSRDLRMVAREMIGTTRRLFQVLYTTLNSYLRFNFENCLSERKMYSNTHVA